MRRMSTVIDVDLSRYFDTIRHSVLLGKIAKRIQDPQVLHLLKQIIKVGGKLCVPQGGPFSPLAANIYLNEVDWFFDAVRRKTAEGDYEAVNYHQFAYYIVITISGHHKTGLGRTCPATASGTVCTHRCGTEPGENQDGEFAEGGSLRIPGV
jgi:RNA-directed DNA polymerase